MGAHHTKDKGDLGTAKAYADLVERGLLVLFPATEHAEFDLVAYDTSTFYRIQVKYRSASTGAMTVRFRSVWADRHGTHLKPWDMSQVDVLCVYCPETDECYYLRPPDAGDCVTLRVTPPKNGQAKNVRLASAFQAFPPRGPETPRDTPRSLPVTGAPPRQDCSRPRHV